MGRSLTREFGDSLIRGHVFLTHFHWDHIQGAPFCAPFYRVGNEFLFYSMRRSEKALKAAIEGQMIQPFFPVDMTMLRSTRHFYDLDFDPIGINGAVIRSAPLFHPQECVAYRIEADEAVFVLATDNEPGSPFHDRSLRELAQGADVLVYDAQYTPEQLSGDRKGWGHSSWLEGTRVAKECGVEHLILFHHDPDNDDAFVDGLVEKARQEFPNTIGAAEGLEIGLPNAKMRDGYRGAVSERRRDARYRLELPIQIAWRDPTGERREARGIALDISRTGIYFVVPNQVPLGQSVELVMNLPDEITHCGELALRCSATLLRQEGNHRSLDHGIASRGVAASLKLLPADSYSHVA